MSIPASRTHNPGEWLAEVFALGVLKDTCGQPAPAHVSGSSHVPRRRVVRHFDEYGTWGRLDRKRRHDLPAGSPRRV